VLELYEPEGAFERLEAWLRDRGFFTPEGADLAAAVYLGYGLSQTLRRTSAPAPPEPCPLPLVACSVRPPGYVGAYDNRMGSKQVGRYSIGEWERTWDAAEYGAAVEAVREAIARGDVYQVNLVQHLSAPFAGEPRALASRLEALIPENRDRSTTFFAGEGWAVASASPELFLARQETRVWTMPIKGTRPAGGEEELRSSGKDAAEHVMIVDLERNDLSRVCEPGSVRWPELMATRRLAGVEHMISTVEGRLRSEVGLAELLEATFPGGSVTGAPKIAAIDQIAALEPVGRGASMGALGWIRGNGDLELALTIRTFALAAGRLHLWVGGGIVWDSDPSEEIEESWTKARPLLEALGASPPLAAPGNVRAGGA
jgi:para-aminobenzoate synthetase component I